LPETTIFVLGTRVSWPADASGRRANLGPFQIGGIPEFWAKIALERGFAILPDSDRYKAMRAEAAKTGWPHIPDPMAVRDLDRDPGMVSVHNRATGKKVRDELPKLENYRAGEPSRQVGIDVMLPK
jgi:hypothetical protein